MDAAILDQPFERTSSDFAANRVERRHGDRFGRVVDDEVDAGHRLERPDVPAVTADDAALHVIGRESDGGNRRLGHDL